MGHRSFDLADIALRINKRTEANRQAPEMSIRLSQSFPDVLLSL